MIKRRVLSVLLIVSALVCACAFPARADGDEAFSLIEEAVSSGYAGEYYTVRTPADEPNTLYVEGCTEIDSKVFLISLAGADSTYVRVFVFPDEQGTFSVKINTAEGNKDYPTAIRGRVVAGETGGQQNSRCYSTRPGYYAIERMPEGFYRLLITRATLDLHAQGVYDRDCDYIWYDESNPLSGYQGFAAKEFPLYVKNNSPRLIRYTDVMSNNAAVRAADTPLRVGSAAWEQYTDVYLKDLEWAMNTNGDNIPLLPEQVSYLRSVADELSAGAAEDYDRALLFYRYICENFYFDSYAFSKGQHAYCNPYDNLYAQRSGVSGPNCINGKVATTCNGFASMMIALCRAEGIPARMVNGAQLTKTRETWNTTGKNYKTEISHWWCEVYADGRWVAIDADRGSCHEWDRSSWAVADDACWKKAASFSYAGFDMNDFELAGSYYYQNIYCASTYLRDIPAPVITAADTSSGYVTLSWSKIAGCEFYYLFRGTDPSSVKYFDYTKGEDATAYVSVDDMEEPDVTYYYRVAARKDGVIGTQSNLIAVCVSSEERAGAMQPPEILRQPSSVSAQPGETVSFSVKARNGDLRYQWQYYSADNDAWYNLTSSAYTGIESDKLSFQATSARDGRQYRCKLSNELFTVYSDPAVLLIGAEGPVITVQPESASVYRGETAVFSVDASGSGLSYQWQYKKPSGGNWVNSTMSGSKTDSLSVQATAARDGYQYRCRVKGGGTTLYSDAAVLTALSCVNVQPEDETVCQGDTATFTVRAKGSDLSYQWQYKKASRTSWNNSTMTGSKTDSLSVQATAARDGCQYRCKVTNNGVVSYSDPATLTAVPLINSQPRDAWTVLGEMASFRVTAGGSATTYQWQYRSSANGSWSNSYQEGYNTSGLRVKAIGKRSGWQYRCRVKNNGVTAYSDPAELHVTSLIITQPKSASGAVGTTVTFTVTAAEGISPSYCWQVSTDGGETWKYTTLSGCKTDTLTVKITRARAGYQYRCRVTNNGVSAISEAVTLSVK